jgi:hypothetical protein
MMIEILELCADQIPHDPLPPPPPPQFGPGFGPPAQPVPAPKGETPKK